MVDFKRLDAAENGEQEDLDTEQQSSEFADLTLKASRRGQRRIKS